MTTTFNPTLTRDGQSAAINADATGFQLAIDAVAFGTSSYDPTGDEHALVTEVKRVTIISGDMVTPYQARIAAVWEDALGTFNINEVGFFAGSVLVAVWSRASGGPLGVKSPGIDFVLFNDLRFVGVPADSIIIQVDDSGGTAALAALAEHEAASDPHPGYVREAKFPDAQGYLWCAVTGTANAILLTLPAGTTITSYAPGQEFRFKATLSNTTAATVNVGTVGTIDIKKAGATALAAGDITAGATYSLIFDGTSAQIFGGVFGNDLAAHVAAADPHTQYLREAYVIDAMETLWCGSAAGSANSLILTTPGGTVLTAYGTGGKQFMFKPSLDNTGPVVANVNGIGSVSVKKNGTTALEPGDLKAGAVYELIFDGTNFQVVGGIGGALQTFTPYTFTATAGQTVFSFPYTVGNVSMFRNGAKVPFTGTNGTSVTLSTACNLNDKVEAQVFTSFNIANAFTKNQTLAMMYFYSSF